MKLLFNLKGWGGGLVGAGILGAGAALAQPLSETRIPCEIFIAGGGLGGGWQRPTRLCNWADRCA
jgi:hypothetical protein